MENPLVEGLHEEAIQARRQRSRMYGQIGGLIICPFIIAGVFLPDHMQAAQCPASAFHHGPFANGADLMVCGLLGTMLALIFVVASIGTKIVSEKAYTIPLILSIIATLAAASVYGDSLGYYYCVTPTDIVTRAGYFEAPQSRGWGSVKSVDVWCWYNSGKGGHYPGATIRLWLDDVNYFPIGLVNGHQVLKDDYSAVRQALDHQTYRLRKDHTINPDLCPIALYEPLRDWTVSP